MIEEYGHLILKIKNLKKIHTCELTQTMDLYISTVGEYVGTGK